MGLLISIGTVLILMEREFAFDSLKWFDKERSLVSSNNQRKRRFSKHASNGDQSNFASILTKIQHCSSAFLVSFHRQNQS